MRAKRRDACAHAWRSMAMPGGLLVQDCAACRASVLDVIQVQIIGLYRMRVKRVKQLKKLKATQLDVRSLRTQLVTAQSMAERLTDALAENYLLRSQLAAAVRKRAS